MPSVHYLQSSFIAGVLNPRLHARQDVRQYYQGLSQGRNVVVDSMGGVRRRGGTIYLAKLPYTLEVQSAAATATAPNGGTANNARDQDVTTALLTTTNLSTTANYVVVHYDLGAAATILYADVRNIFITAGASTDFDVQYSADNATWFSASGGMSLETEPKDYRIAFNVSARYWRLARISTADGDLGSAKISITDFTLFSQTTTVSQVQAVSFEPSDEESYFVVLTDRAASVYDAFSGTLEAVVTVPYLSAEVAEVDAASTENVIILTHKNHQPIKIIRTRTAGLSWWREPVVFTALPQYDYADGDSPTPLADIQTLTFTDFNQGDTFQVELGGARSGSIAYQGANASTAINIQRAMQKLYTVGFTGVDVDYTSGTTFTITLSGESADAHQLMVGMPLATLVSDTAAIAAVHSQVGSPRREDVWSDERGWPVCVTFHEGRLWIGGGIDLPQAYAGSVVNDFFNFAVGEGLEDDAVFGAINTEKLNRVLSLKSGRFLQVFASGGEFRFTESPITPGDVPRNQTEYGSRRIRPVSIDGSTLFVQKTGKSIRDYIFRYEEEAYSSASMSKLAAHLINDVKGFAAWQGSSDEDVSHVYVINGDGTIACYNTDRDQEIAAWTQWTTEGEFRSVAVAGEIRVFAIEREIDGVSALYFEQLDDEYYLDCAKRASSGTATDAWSGFLHLAGEELRVRADGFVLANVTPDGSGEFTTETEVQELEAGLNWTPLGATMPLNSDFGSGGNYMRKKRVVRGQLHVFESLGVKLNGRPLPDRYFDIDSFDEAPEPFTGVHSIEETTNWDEGTLILEFTQDDPLPFHILALDMKVETT